METYQNRSQVPDKYKWNLTDFFKTEAEFNESYTYVKDNIKELNKYKGLLNDPNKLETFLDMDFKFAILLENLYVYAYLKNDEMLGIADNLVRKNKVENLYNEYNLNTSFFAPELLGMSISSYEKLCSAEKLKKYLPLLDRIYREKRHVLSEEKEQIIASLTNASNSFDGISSNLVNNEHNYGKIKMEDGKVVDIATNNYRTLMKNKDQKVRIKTYRLMNKKLLAYAGTECALLNSYAKLNDEVAKIHNYKNAWDAHLFELNISDKVFKTLVKKVEDNTAILQKYYTLKKQVLKTDTMHAYDVSVPMSKLNKEYSIEEAQNICLNAIKPLGEDYYAHFKKIFDNHYIDYCQYKGKCSGGYSFATLDHDSRIMMNYTSNFDAVSTIAHEGGHNVHHQYTTLNNDLPYREVPSIMAEVASLTNECLLSYYMVDKGSTTDEKLIGLENVMDVIVSNLFGAVREGKIEQDMYKLIEKNASVTKEDLNKLVHKSLKKYYGKNIKLDELSDITWALRSHYYMDYYLYSYAISISIASNIASRIIKGDKKMLNNYLTYLKTGSDKWPTEAFKILGIDLEDENVYQNAINYFDELIAKYNTLLNKEVK